jgi:hypothetical protein
MGGLYPLLLLQLETTQAKFEEGFSLTLRVNDQGKFIYQSSFPTLKRNSCSIKDDRIALTGYCQVYYHDYFPKDCRIETSPTID